MNWICPRCRLIVAGGLYCPDCSPEVKLLDIADPRNREYLVGQGDSIRRLYAARLTMLRFFIGTLLGLAGAGWLVRAGVAYPSPTRWLWFAGAAASALFGLLAFAPATRALQRVIGHGVRRLSQKLFSRRWAKSTLRALR